MSDETDKPAFDEAAAEAEACERNLAGEFYGGKGYDEPAAFVEGARWQWEEVGQRDYADMLKFQASFLETLQRCDALSAEVIRLREALKGEGDGK